MTPASDSAAVSCAPVPPVAVAVGACVQPWPGLVTMTVWMAPVESTVPTVAAGGTVQAEAGRNVIGAPAV